LTVTRSFRRDGSGTTTRTSDVKEVVSMVTRYDPFRELDSLASRLLDQASGMSQSMRAMPMDLFRSGDHYVLLCDLPGIDPGSVDVGVDGRILTIRAERTQRSEGVEWLTQERPTGTFVRQLTLGSGLAVDRIEATYNDGVLSLAIPVAEEAKPRKISVSHGNGSNVLAGETAEQGSITANDQRSVDSA
jgi:HSP20 family protein